MSNLIKSPNRNVSGKFNPTSFLFDTESAINKMMQDAFSVFNSDSIFDQAKNNTYPKVNVYEDKNGWHFECAVPGVKKEDVDIHFSESENSLTIESKKQDQNEKKESNCVIKELRKSRFKRSWVFKNDKIDQDNISAKFENGMVYITVPVFLAEEKENKLKRITIK